MGAVYPFHLRRSNSMVADSACPCGHTVSITKTKNISLSSGIQGAAVSGCTPKGEVPREWAFPRVFSKVVHRLFHHPLRVWERLWSTGRQRLWETRWERSREICSPQARPQPPPAAADYLFGSLFFCYIFPFAVLKSSYTNFRFMRRQHEFY